MQIRRRFDCVSSHLIPAPRKPVFCTTFLGCKFCSGRSWWVEVGSDGSPVPLMTIWCSLLGNLFVPSYKLYNKSDIGHPYSWFFSALILWQIHAANMTMIILHCIAHTLLYVRNSCMYCNIIAFQSILLFPIFTGRSWETHTC